MEGRKELKIDGMWCKQMRENCGMLLGGTQRCQEGQTRGNWSVGAGSNIGDERSLRRWNRAVEVQAVAVKL